MNGLGFSGVFYGLLLGALIPLVASVGPISLAGTPDKRFGRSSAQSSIIKFSIEYGDQAGNVNISLLIIGGVCCVWLYYILFPASCLVKLQCDHFWKHLIHLVGHAFRACFAVIES